MDGEERNASLPILGSHETFPRTDPTGPRNPVVVTVVVVHALSAAARPHKGAAHLSRKGKGGPAKKMCKKIAANPGNLGGQGLRGPI